MAVKLSSLTFSKRIPRWVKLNASLSSLSCANLVEINNESDGNLLNSCEFESKVQFLMNKLHPESLIHVLDSTKDVNSSLKLFKWASLQKKFKHNAETYHRIILKLGMNGNIEEMEGFCKEMVKEKFPHFDEALLSLIYSFVKHHKLDEALRLLSCICYSHSKPSLNVFNALMGALVKAKKGFRDVLFVYKEMVKAGVIPNVETLNYLLKTLFEADRVDVALNQYRRMNKKGCIPNSQTFEVLIGGLISRNLVDESLVILNELFDLGCDLDLSFYSHIIPQLCSVNQYEAGMRLVRRMRASNVTLDSRTYGVMIHVFCQNLCLDDAISLYKEMMDSGLTPPDNVYTEIVSGLCKSYKFGEAKKFLDDYAVSEVFPYNALLGAYCKSGDLVAAIDLFYEMFENNRTDILSWNMLILCLCGKRQIKKAMEVICRMIVCSSVPNSDTYSALIIGNCKLDKLEEALLLFNQVQKNCLVLDSPSYAELVECLCQKGKVQEAAAIFCYMSGKNLSLQSTSFNMLIKGVCERGKISYAIQLLFLARASGTFYSSATYNTVMGGLSKYESADSLLVMLSQMIVDGCSPCEETYCTLIQSMSRANQTSHCACFLHVMLNQGLLPDSETIASLLSCLASHSQLHKILYALDKLMLSSDTLDSSKLNALITGLWKEGYKSEAGRFLDIMLERGWVPDTTTHRMVMGYVVKEVYDLGKCGKEQFRNQDEVSMILEDAFPDI